MAGVGIRVAERYRPVCAGSCRVAINDGNAADCPLLDVSVGGLALVPPCRGCHPCSLKVFLKDSSFDLGPEDIKARNSDDPHGRCHVVLTDAGSRRAAQWIEQNQSCLERVPNNTALAEHVLKIETISQGRVLRSHLFRWVQANGLGDDEALAALTLAEHALSSANYLDETSIASRVQDLLAPILADSNGAKLDCVSIRMPDIYSKMLWRSVFDQITDQPRFKMVKYWGNMADLVGYRGGMTGRHWLILVDLFINTGRTRDNFLSTLFSYHKELCERFEKLFVVTPILQDGTQTTPVPLPPHFAQSPSEVTKFGELRSNSSRPPHCTPQLEAVAEVLARLDRRVGADLDGPTNGNSAFLMLPFGCPPHNPAILWTESNGWVPLLNAVDFYVPTARPFPCAPVFQAYPNTLHALLGRIDHFRPVLLHSPQGVGKTFLAARALDAKRAERYVFWHSCLKFETIDNILIHMDSFLASLGVPGSLMHDWEGGTANAEALGIGLLKSLRQLDRPLVMVFDEIRSLFPRDRRQIMPETRAVLRFLRALATPPPSEGSPHVRQIVSIVLILQTHENGMDPFDEDPLLSDVADVLGLRDEDLLALPIDGADLFEDPLPLLQRLLSQDLAHKEEWQRFGRLLSHQDPYKTWLVAFCVNRDQAKATRLLRLDRSRFYSDISVLHRAANEFLTPRELNLLKIASAFSLPWTVFDIDNVLQATEPNRSSTSDDVTKTIAGLLQHRCPFIIRLAGTQKRMEFVNSRLCDEPEHAFHRDYFEMPSVSARFFSQLLKTDSDHAAAVYRALADVMKGKCEPDTSAKKDSVYLVEEIGYLCQAGLLDEAARRYFESGQSLGWERCKRVGREILDAATRPRSAGRPGLSSNDECRTRALCARALAELLSIADARMLLDHGQGESWFTEADEVNRQRICFEQARCAQYEGDWEAARELYESVESSLVNGPSASAHRSEAENVLLVEGCLARSQCAMAQGELDRAQGLLNRAFEGQNYQLSRPQKERLETVAERHRGTLHLLCGESVAAASLFGELAHSDRDGLASYYRLARAELERSRLVEAKALWQSCPHMVKELHETLDKADVALRAGTELLERGSTPEVRHYAAIRTARVELELLRFRNTSPRPSAESLRAMEGQIEDIGRAWQDNLRDQRGVEIAYLRSGIRRERDLLKLQETLPATDENGRREGAVREVVEAWDDMLKKTASYTELANPFQVGRAFYEILYYLLRLAGVCGRTEGNGIDLRSTRAYRRADDAYLTIRAPSRAQNRASEGLQALALKIYRGEWGLQEKFEASVLLSSWGNGTAVFCPECQAAGSSPAVPSPAEVLDSLVRASAKESDNPADRILTIPAKVCCHLGGLSGDLSVLHSGRWPERSPDWAKLADKIEANWVRESVRSWRKDEHWEERLRPFGVSRIRDRIDRMMGWFDI